MVHAIVGCPSRGQAPEIPAIRLKFQKEEGRMRPCPLMLMLLKINQVHLKPEIPIQA